MKKSYTYKNEERLLNGKVLLQLRNNIYQTRIYKGEGSGGYVWRSTKEREIEAARQKAMQFYAEIEHKKINGIPLVCHTFSKVLDEYVAVRQAQYDRGNYIRGKRAPNEQTSVYNLRQIQRKAKFWHAYAGKKKVSEINDAVLRDYVDWRRDYYHKMKPEKRPGNCSLNPADKTLQDETVFALSVLKWATERGYARVALFAHLQANVRQPPAIAAALRTYLARWWAFCNAKNRDCVCRRPASILRATHNLLHCWGR